MAKPTYMCSCEILLERRKGLLLWWSFGYRTVSTRFYCTANIPSVKYTRSIVTLVRQTLCGVSCLECYIHRRWIHWGIYTCIHNMQTEPVSMMFVVRSGQRIYIAQSPQILFFGLNQHLDEQTKHTNKREPYNGYIYIRFRVYQTNYGTA